MHISIVLTHGYLTVLSLLDFGWYFGFTSEFSTKGAVMILHLPDLCCNEPLYNFEEYSLYSQ